MDVSVGIRNYIGASTVDPAPSPKSTIRRPVRRWWTRSNLIATVVSSNHWLQKPENEPPKRKIALKLEENG